MTDPEPRARSQAPRHIRTGRYRWLAEHPDYFEQSVHTLSLPLAYDRLIRVYQSPAERQAEGKKQGWAKMLEGALIRGEAKRDQAVDSRRRAALDATGQDAATMKQRAGMKDVPRRNGLKPLPEEMEESDDGITMSELGAELEDAQVATESEQRTSRWDVPLGIVPAAEILEAHDDDFITVESSPSVAEPGPEEQTIDGLSKTQALQRWHELLRRRFVAGEDEDANYDDVDRDRSAERAWRESVQQDTWFETEAESWSDSGTERGRKLMGETGVQDF